MVDKRKASRRIVIFLLIISTFLATVFSFVMFCAYSDLSVYIYGVKSLTHKQLTVEKAKQIRTGRRRDIIQYQIIFKEMDDTFIIESRMLTKLKENASFNLHSGDVLSVYYKPSYTKFKYKICALNKEDTTIFSINDYIEEGRDGHIAIVIMFGVLLLIFLFFAIYSLVSLIKTKNPESLGKKIIEYYVDCNLIEVYNSPICCSLLVNNKVVSQDWVADRSLGAEMHMFHYIQRSDRRISILVNQELFTISLYYDNKLVAKKVSF